MINSNKIISERELLEFSHQICNGYSELMNKKMIHSDIKPENIMIHKNLYKIGDFGLSKILIENDMNISCKRSPLYMAPELI
jgi:serine/threonine protein kinase